MNNTPPPMPSGAEDPDNKLTSPKFDEFKEALETLYIMANQSGRIQFAKAWPAAAEPILGEELIRHDVEGSPDKERRAEIEIEAEDRRIALLEFMDGIEENSIQDGAVQIEYVKQHVERMGRDLSLLIYGLKLVDRFIAPPPPPPSAEDEGAEGEVSKNPDGGAQAEASEEVKGVSAPQGHPEIEVSPEFEAELKRQEQQRDHVQSAVEHDIEKELEAERKAAEEASAPSSPFPSAEDLQPENPVLDPMDRVKPIDAQPVPEQPAQPAQPQNPAPEQTPPESQPQSTDTNAPRVQPPPSPMPADEPRVQPPPAPVSSDEPRVQPAPLSEPSGQPAQTVSPISPVNPAVPVAPSQPAAPAEGIGQQPSSPVPNAAEKPEGQKPVSMKFVSSKDKPNSDDNGGVA